MATEHIYPVLHQRPPLSMSLADAAKELGVSRPQLEQLIKGGGIKCHNLKPGGDRRISYAEMVRFIELRESEGVQ